VWRFIKWSVEFRNGCRRNNYKYVWVKKKETKPWCISFHLCIEGLIVFQTLSLLPKPICNVPYGKKATNNTHILPTLYSSGSWNLGWILYHLPMSIAPNTFMNLSPLKQSILQNRGKMLYSCMINSFTLYLLIIFQNKMDSLQSYLTYL
jgi:hypothetical protein